MAGEAWDESRGLNASTNSSGWLHGMFEHWQTGAQRPVVRGDAMEGQGSEEGQTARFRRRHTNLWPEEGALAAAWEGEVRIREIFRTNTSKLLAWPSRDLIGVASLKALSLNVDVVGKAMEVWGQSCQQPRTMSIDWLKQEAGFELGCRDRGYSL